MSLRIPTGILEAMQTHGEEAYPEEGAGFLLGTDDTERWVQQIMPLQNAREPGARHNRYLLGPQEYMEAELEAERRQLTVIGVFHSHPDHPNRPSEFDREWAQPGFSYVITAINAGKSAGSRSWRLAEDRSSFVEEAISTGNEGV